MKTDINLTLLATLTLALTFVACDQHSQAEQPTWHSLDTLFGISEESPEFQAFAATHKLGYSYMNDEKDSAHHWTQDGAVAIVMKNYQVAYISLQVSSKSKIKGAGRYTHELPFGLTSNDKEEQIIMKLGKPDKGNLWIYQNYRIVMSFVESTGLLDSMLITKDHLAMSHNSAANQSTLPRTPNELNRVMAAEILNRKLSKPTISTVEFSKSGLEKALENKLLEQLSFPPRCKITEKGMSIFGTIVSKDKDFFPWPLVGMGPCLDLKTEIAEKISSVDGIRDLGNGMKLVEFTTDYIFPPNTPPEITQYLYSGRRGKAVFALYDDGWRISEN
ncbi:MAG: hypothetical protein M0Q93_11810 [Terrimicrobiaceae bacterium]|nr:hypothetical protein [Terrimicrobiaceae bacterium]